MVRVNGRIAANLAGTLSKIAARKRTLDGNMSQVFLGMPPTPIGLTGIGFQIELVHAHMDSKLVSICESGRDSVVPYRKMLALPHEFLVAGENQDVADDRDW